LWLAIAGILLIKNAGSIGYPIHHNIDNAGRKQDNTVNKSLCRIRTAISKKKLNQREKKHCPNIVDGPDVIRTHDLPVISRAHHRAMLRAQKFA
jgi:hypothetical protein